MENGMNKRIKDVMSAVFDMPPEAINEASSPDTIGAWDSMRHLNLILAIEEEFNIRFSDEQTAQMLNYRLIVELVKEALANS